MMIYNIYDNNGTFKLSEKSDKENNVYLYKYDKEKVNTNKTLQQSYFYSQFETTKKCKKKCENKEVNENKDLNENKDSNENILLIVYEKFVNHGLLVTYENTKVTEYVDNENKNEYENYFEKQMGGSCGFFSHFYYKIMLQ